MECGDAGKDATTCEGVGKKKFMEQKGAVAFTDGTSTGKVDAKKEAMVTKEWEDKKAEVTELAKGKKEGACYNVPDCSRISDGSGINMTDPFRLVGVDLDTAEVKTHPPLCTFAKQDCPWALDAAKAMLY